MNRNLGTPVVMPVVARASSAASPRPSAVARARLIYGEAKAGAATRLWEAVLGDRVDTTPPRVIAGAGRDAAVLTSETGLSAALLAPPVPYRTTQSDMAGERRDPPRRRGSPHPLASIPPSPSPTLGPNQGYAPWLRAASDRTGVPGTTIAAIVGAEAAKGADGRWLTASRNPRSSAAGLGQFLARTWIGEAERAGTWLHQLASLNGWLTTDGRVRHDALATVLALRYDARAAIETVADHARHNLAQLHAVRAIKDDSLEAVTRTAYVAHHLGIGDAIRFLRGALDKARAARLLVAQIGVSAAAGRIARSANASVAHRSWLTDFIARAVKPWRIS